MLYTGDSSVMTSILKVNTIQDATNSTTAMTVDTAGRILTPARPSFCARPTAEITNQTSGDIVFGEAGAVNEDSHGNHNVGGHYDTSTGKFTAPVTGIYFFSFSAMTYAENDCEVKLFLNTQDVVKFNTNLTNDESNYESFHGSTVIKMTASDFFHPKVAAGNFHASPNHSQFSGFLIG